MTSMYSIAALSVLSIVFGLQMISLYKDPTGENVFSKVRPSNHTDARCLQMRMVQLEKRLSEVSEVIIPELSQLRGWVPYCTTSFILKVNKHAEVPPPL